MGWSNIKIVEKKNKTRWHTIRNNLYKCTRNAETRANFRNYILFCKATHIESTLGYAYFNIIKNVYRYFFVSFFILCCSVVFRILFLYMPVCVCMWVCMSFGSSLVELVKCSSSSCDEVPCIIYICICYYDK